MVSTLQKHSDSHRRLNAKWNGSNVSFLVATLTIFQFIFCTACQAEESQCLNPFVGNWGLEMPDGAAGWLRLTADNDRGFAGELWTVGGGKRLSEIKRKGDTLHFVRHVRVGAPEFAGGPPTGKRLPCNYAAQVQGDSIELIMYPPSEDSLEEVRFRGVRLPPLPPQPDLSKVEFEEPIELFNGRNLDGWRLTNPQQRNGWQAVNGVLTNSTPKLDFAPYSKYGNLRTEQEFTDFHLKLEFKVPPGGNSGVYLRGMYEAQVLDRDSKMQGIHGVGSIFGRIQPSENAGKPGNEWNSYEITLVDRHVTVVLNGISVIENQPIQGCTNGALFADDRRAGPIYLQGDHTAVSYRNIVLRPVRTKPAAASKRVESR